MAHELAVAAAEDSAFSGTTIERLVDRAELTARLDAVREGTWWRSCFAAPPVIRLVVPPERTITSTVRSRHDGFELRIADSQRTLSTVAHELAHLLAGLEAAHDARFRAAYVDTATVIAGIAAGEWLAAAFDAAGLDVARRSWPAPFSAEGAGFVVR